MSHVFKKRINIFGKDVEYVFSVSISDDGDAVTAKAEPGPGESASFIPSVDMRLSTHPGLRVIHHLLVDCICNEVERMALETQSIDKPREDGPAVTLH